MRDILYYFIYRYEHPEIVTFCKTMENNEGIKGFYCLRVA